MGVRCSVNYYNDNDKFACEWLKKLIEYGLIPIGDVDERSILDVDAKDLKKYTQCHFFAGIGGWAEALRLADWPTDRPVWTGSCPCQPLSVAGLGKGAEDERHVWPVFASLILESQPPVVFGEQVASADGREWFSGVRLDLEEMGYAVGAADLCAASVGSPNIRQRLWWVANAKMPKRRALPKEHTGRRVKEAGGSSGFVNGCDGGVADTDRQRLAGERLLLRKETTGRDKEEILQTAGSGEDGGVGNPERERLEGHPGNVNDRNQPGRNGTKPDGSIAEAGDDGFWSRYELVNCLDGKARRIEPGSPPLVDGIPNRVGLLRGYGNAINPYVGAEFIRAFKEIENNFPAT